MPSFVMFKRDENDPRGDYGDVVMVVVFIIM